MPSFSILRRLCLSVDGARALAGRWTTCSTRHRKMEGCPHDISLYVVPSDRICAQSRKSATEKWEITSLGTIFDEYASQRTLLSLGPEGSSQCPQITVPIIRPNSGSKEFLDHHMQVPKGYSREFNTANKLQCASRWCYPLHLVH